MLIARTEIDGGNGPETRQFGVIGTCRVHNPMRCLIDAGKIEMVWREFNAFTHGPMEAIQYLEFVRGRRPIPDSFAPLIFRTEQTPAVGERLISAIGQVDFLIVEISAFARLNCGAYEFQQNYFSENFIRKGGADYLGWWRDVSQSKPSMESAERLVQQKEGGLPVHDEEILRTLKFCNLSDEDFTAAIRSLSRLARVPLLLVPHFSFDEEDNSISSMRARNRRLVGAAASDLGHAFFDPSPMLMAYGRTRALKNEGRDLYHYSDDFDAEVGEAMHRFMANMDLGAANSAVIG